MPYIKVDLVKLSQYQQTVENVRAITGSSTDVFCAVSNSIEAKLRQMNNIDGQLRRIQEDLYSHQHVMAKMTTFLDTAQYKYRLLSNYDNVGNADLGAGAVSAAPNVPESGSGPSYIGGTNTEPTPEKESPDVGNVTVASSPVRTVPLADDRKEAADDNYKMGDYTAATTAGIGAAAVIVGAVDAAAAQLEEIDQAQILRLAASELNVAAEDLLEDIEAGAYSLRDIVQCLEGKATDANKFIQNAANKLRTLTGTQDIRFEQKDGYWILSGYQRDSKANDLVKIFHDGTGIGSRYKEDTLENTPVLGVVFKGDQLADKAEKAAQLVEKTADLVDKGTAVVLDAVEAGHKIREHGTEAADKIADVLADDSIGKDEKIAATTAIVTTSVVSSALDVAAAHAGNTVSSVVGKLVGSESGDETLGTKVGEIAGKLVTGGMELVSNVVSSDAVVNQITQGNLEIGNVIKDSGKAIGEAGRKLLDADSPGEVLQNVGNFATVVGKAGKDVVATVATETAEAIYTVGKETVIAAGEMVGDAVKAKYQTVSQNVKNEYETIKGFKDDVVGGINTMAVLAGETCSVLKSSDKDISMGEAIALAAKEMGINQEDIHNSINKGLCTTEDIFEYLDGKATGANNFVKEAASILRTISGATDVVFQNKDGYIIVSEFTRKGWANTLVKTFNDGTGIGTRYKPETLKDTPVIGMVYKADGVMETMDKVATGVTAVVSTVSGVIDAGRKLNDIWDDETLTKKEKIYDTAAVAVTSVVATALDVAAPFAGAAVKTAVTGAISAVLPGVGPVIGNAVGAVAGALVENGIQMVSDVITSEAVVSQVSDSMMKVGDAVAAETKAVSDAGKKLLESENAKEALKNTAEFVGTALASGTKVVATAVTEGAKVAVTVAQETAKAVGEAVAAKVQAVGDAAVKVATNVAKVATQVGDAVVAGAEVVSDAAKEAAEKAAKALEAAKEEAKRKAEELARAAEEKARQAAQKLAEEVKRKAEEAARIAAETKRKAEEAARKAAEEIKRKAEEAARIAAETKRKAEEAARKAAEELRRKAEEAKRKAEEAARKAAEEARRKAQEAARKIAEAKRKAEEAAKKAAEAARKAAEAAKKKAAEAAKKKAAEAAAKAKKALSKW